MEKHRKAMESDRKALKINGEAIDKQYTSNGKAFENERNNGEAMENRGKNIE